MQPFRKSFPRVIPSEREGSLILLFVTLIN
jgi:hypothetical protein